MPSDERRKRKKEATSLFKLCKKNLSTTLNVVVFQRIINKILRTLLNDLLNPDPVCSTGRLGTVLHRSLIAHSTLKCAHEKYANEVTISFEANSVSDHFANPWSELPFARYENYCNCELRAARLFIDIRAKFFKNFVTREEIFLF